MNIESKYLKLGRKLSSQLEPSQKREFIKRGKVLVSLWLQQYHIYVLLLQIVCFICLLYKKTQNIFLFKLQYKRYRKKRMKRGQDVDHQEILTRNIQARNISLFQDDSFGTLLEVIINYYHYYYYYHYYLFIIIILLLLLLLLLMFHCCCILLLVYCCGCAITVTVVVIMFLQAPTTSGIHRSHSASSIPCNSLALGVTMSCSDNTQMSNTFFHRAMKTSKDNVLFDQIMRSNSLLLNLVSVVESLSSKIRILGEENGVLHEKHNALAAVAKKVKKDLQSSESNLEDVKTQLEERDKDVLLLEQQLSESDQKLADKTSIIQNKEDEILLLKSSLQTEEASKSECNETLRGKHNEALKQVSQLQDSIALKDELIERILLQEKEAADERESFEAGVNFVTDELSKLEIQLGKRLLAKTDKLIVDRAKEDLYTTMLICSDLSHRNNRTIKALVVRTEKLYTSKLQRVEDLKKEIGKFKDKQKKVSAGTYSMEN